MHRSTNESRQDKKKSLEKDYQYDSQSITDYLIDEKDKCERDLDFNWLTSATIKKAYQVLLVFHSRDDYQCEMLDKVALKLGWIVTLARNVNEATSLYLRRKHNLVIIDRRSSSRSQEADNICKILIHYSIPKNCTIVALVKRTYFTAPHKDDAAVLQLLNIGYSRALMECSHEGILMNELIGIHAQEGPQKCRLAAAQLMYYCFERNKAMSILTLVNNNIIFVNRASEKLDIKRQDLIGRNIGNFVVKPDINNISLKLSKSSDYKGEIVWKKPTNETIELNLLVVPIFLSANNCNYYAYFFDSIFKENNSVKGHGSKKRHSTILQDLPQEAPLTKVVTLLTSAMSYTDDFSVNSQIDSALQLLKYVDLHSPHLKEEQQEIDPTIEDIIESVKNENSSSRRQSPVHSIHSTHSTYSSLFPFVELSESSVPKLLKEPLGPPELENLLQTAFDWNFDIFKLEKITGRRPLYYAGVVLMGHYRVAERLQCDERTLRNWLTVLESNYNISVEYHNSTHATDVMQALARFMRSERLKRLLEPLDEVAALIAAAAHDLGHPGKSSQFLCNGNNKLAILYNDLTVLESHHSALTFKVTLSHDSVNIFKNLNKELYRFMRSNIIDMILATEMTKHFEHLAKFVNVCNTKMDSDDESTGIYTDDVINTNVFLIPENLTMTKRMIIKCADVSNPTRAMREYVEWTRRIAMEYFEQTDEEKSRNWPVMMPMFDRSTCSIPKSQIGFVDYIIHDMMEAWDDMPELVGNMNQNYEKWKAYEEQGIVSIEEIVELQSCTPELQLYQMSSRNSDERSKKVTKFKLSDD